MSTLQCSCGNRFAPCEATFRGVQDYGIEKHALHNCPACQSTRAVVIFVALSERESWKGRTC